MSNTAGTDVCVEVHAALQEMNQRKSFEDKDLDLSLEAVSRALALHRRVTKRAVNPVCPWKSALLMRILEGRLPLKYAPPKCFSYPRYRLVESSERFRPLLGGTVPVDSTGEGERGIQGLYGIVMDQSFYTVTQESGSARTIMEMLTGRRPFDGREFVELSDCAPVWTVRQGQWPAWELTVAVRRSSGRRDFVSKPYPDSVESVKWGEWGLPIDPVVITKGADEIEEDRAMHGRAAQPTYSSDPSMWDRLEFKRRTWELRKSAEWDGYDIPYFQDYNAPQRA